MIRISIITIMVYCFLVGALMYLNTVVFGLGDPSFGESGWKVYWPVWCVFYAPAIVTALLCIVDEHSIKSLIMLSIALLLILLVLEISFYFDISWLIVVIELVVLIGLSNYAGKYIRASVTH